MLKDDFNIGPFTIRPAGRMQVAGEQQQLFNVEYGDQVKREKVPVKPGTQAQVTTQLEEAIGNVVTELRSEYERRYRIDLVDGFGEKLTSFYASTSTVSDMSAGLVDDRFAYWLRSENRLQSQPVTLSEYARIRASEERPANAWIADLLPEEVLALDPEEWRPPTSWELRHAVGVGSFTGITGAKAADLVGVNHANFRKYTAREGAKTRQNISFAMWHLLMHRLEIQRMPEGWQ